MKYNIAFGGIHIESSIFTPYVSEEKDFEILRGAQLLLARYPFLSEYEDIINPIGLIHARALPGGIVSRKFFDKWLFEFLERLKSEEIDGVFFDIHGAMTVEGLEDAEGYISLKIRETIGDTKVISSPMDLHGNVSENLFNSTNILTAYRTAPHIDVIETRKRALDNLIYLLNDREKKIYSLKANIPILLSGEQTSTEVEPGKSIYESIKMYENKEGILDISILMGFPWADEVRNHLSVLVYGEDKELTEKTCKDISKMIYEKHKEFEFVGPTYQTDKAIDIAFKSNMKPFFISDTGDNPGAGGRGDLVILLEKIYEYSIKNNCKKKVLFASIFDNKSIERIYETKKGKVSLDLGNILGNQYTKAFRGEFEIVNTFNDDLGARSALIKSDNIYIIVNEKRAQYGRIDMFKKAGIKDLRDFDIIVIKMGYLEPELFNVKKGWVMALSQGAVSQDLVNIDYKNLKRPIYPLDEIDYSLIDYINRFDV